MPSAASVRSVLLAALLAPALALAQLPPNHPPVPDKPATPHEHTPASEAPPPGMAKPLPPGHPPMGTMAPPAVMPPGHPPANRGTPAPSSEELLKKLDETPGLKDREKTFDIAFAVAKLYHSNGRFEDAAEYFRQAWEIGKPVRAEFAKVRKEKVDRATCTARLTIDQAAAQLSTVDSKQRAACLHGWMDSVAEAAVLRGESLFLAGDAKGALATLDGVLAESPQDADALFARGSIFLETQGDDVAALRRARADFAAIGPGADPQRAARAQKLLARADELIAAGGVTKNAEKRAAARRPLPSSIPSGSMATRPGPPALSQETIEAFQKVERTPELEQRLAKLIVEGETHLSKGRFQEALDQYRQVMPLDPNNGRVRAGLAWAMVGLQKPAADRIWGVAVESDPAAVEKLGETLKAQGDEQGAKALWTRLAQSAPDYAQKSGLAGKLR